MATANPQIEVKVKTTKSGHEAPANTRTKMQCIMPFSAAWSRPRAAKCSSQVNFDRIPTHSKGTSMGRQEHSGSLDLILLRQRYARMVMRTTMMMMSTMVTLTKTMRMKCHLLAKALDPSPQRGASCQQTRPLKKTPRET